MTDSLLFQISDEWTQIHYNVEENYMTTSHPTLLHIIIPSGN